MQRDGRERRLGAARARDAGLSASTRVVYTSDHGDNLGARGLWGKSTLYEESAGVPLIMAGPGIAAGTVVATPVSHVDCAPTFLDVTGVPRPLGADSLPGASLVDIANGGTPERPVISEYHAIGSVAGAFMLRFDRWKYCHYVAYAPQLFDLAADPEETTDLAGDPRSRECSPKASGGCGRCSIRKPSTRAQRSARPNCSRGTAAATPRSRAATSASRPRPAPPPKSTSPAVPRELLALAPRTQPLAALLRALEAP